MRQRHRRRRRGWQRQHGDGGGGNGNTGGGGSTTAQACDGSTICPSGMYCWYADQLCGAGQAKGQCQYLPTNCGDNQFPAPVCGCNKTVYPDACAAAAAGAALSAKGGCTLDTGKAACGSSICDPATQYCVITANDVMGEADVFRCTPLPDPCSGKTPDCTCVGTEGGCPSCEVDATTGLVTSTCTQ